MSPGAAANAHTGNKLEKTPTQNGFFMADTSLSKVLLFAVGTVRPYQPFFSMPSKTL
jgi:hypothetical protein